MQTVYARSDISFYPVRLKRLSSKRDFILLPYGKCKERGIVFDLACLQ
jgi:hypothetical protein